MRRRPRRSVETERDGLERRDARQLSAATQSLDRLVDGDLLRKLARTGLPCSRWRRLWSQPRPRAGRCTTIAKSSSPAVATRSRRSFSGPRCRRFVEILGPRECNARSLEPGANEHGWIFSTLLVLETLVAILLLPVLLAAVCWLALRLIDDRGLYSVSPFLELAIAAGGLIEAFVLRSTGPDRSWHQIRSGPRTMSGASICRASTRPPSRRRCSLLSAAVLVRSDRKLARGMALDHGVRLALLPVVVVSGFAWRSPWAIVAAVLFLPISMTSAVVLHCLIIMTYWVVHWLNFWVLFVLVLLFQMRRHEGNDRHLLAP